jgi:hypothetical protein
MRLHGAVTLPARFVIIEPTRHRSQPSCQKV